MESERPAWIQDQHPPANIYLQKFRLTRLRRTFIWLEETKAEPCGGC
ncbi:unnamed protein product [Rhodiola kirilowii]